MNEQYCHFGLGDQQFEFFLSESRSEFVSAGIEKIEEVPYQIQVV